jgi:hypothetical protein
MLQKLLIDQGMQVRFRTAQVNFWGTAVRRLMALRCYGDLGNRRGGRYLVFSAAGLERSYGKISTGRAGCRLVVRRDFPRDGKNPKPAHRKPFPPRITETGPRSGVLPPEQQAAANAIRTAMRLRPGNSSGSLAIFAAIRRLIFRDLDGE